MDQPATRVREVRALVDAMDALSITAGWIQTDTGLDEITEGRFTIRICSLAEWRLEMDSLSAKTQ